MVPDLIVFFEPNIDCDLSLFDAAFDPILEMGHLEVTPVMERK